MPDTAVPGTPEGVECGDVQTFVEGQAGHGNGSQSAPERMSRNEQLAALAFLVEEPTNHIKHACL